MSCEMFQTADELLSGYERGRVSRRDLLAVLAGMGLGGTSLSAQQPDTPQARAQRAALEKPANGRRVTHINLKVSDLERSIAFYEKVFGPGIRREKTNVNYRVGTGPDRLDISLQNDAQVKQEGRLKGFPTIWHTSLYTKPGTWEHIEIYVNNLAPVTAALKAAGVEMEVSGSHVWTHDPDGALLQITDGPDH